MVRTKGQIRGAKSKGSQFEMDVEASLQQKYPDCFRTHERGYVQQYDLKSDKEQFAVECKRLKGISWNQAKKYFHKLMTVKPTNYEPLLIFKANQQPVLVMFMDETYSISVKEFENYFGVPFIKHEPIKRKKF